MMIFIDIIIDIIINIIRIIRIIQINLHPQNYEKPRKITTNSPNKYVVFAFNLEKFTPDRIVCYTGIVTNMIYA